MYAWLWESLPGPTPLRFLLLALIALLILALLFLVVFPAVDSWLPIDESEISSSAAAFTVVPA
ncbi:hypothetical protein N9D66_01540 [Candidatus Nanopelagicales bacterium]|nr:hypothetical protein [Candidatus Nanopelagicales bacterium]